jgi:hypothetical protein
MSNKDADFSVESSIRPEIKRFRAWVETAPVLAVIATIVVGGIAVAELVLRSLTHPAV